jgi:hypothetical protein
VKPVAREYVRAELDLESDLVHAPADHAIGVNEVHRVLAKRPVLQEAKRKTGSYRRRGSIPGPSRYSSRKVLKIRGPDRMFLRIMIQFSETV